MNEKKITFKRSLLGLRQDDVESYVCSLMRQLDFKESKICDLEREKRIMEKERHDLLKQLNLLKEVFQEQNKSE